MGLEVVNRRAAAILCAGLSAIAGLSAVGCGVDDGSVSFDRGDLRVRPPADARRGGELTVLAAGDVDSLDPAGVLGQFSYMVAGATQRRLVTEAPGRGQRIVPDIATGMPTVNLRERSLTFRIRPGVRFSPPVNREVRAADFKYAIERLLLPGVARGDTGTLLDGLAGVERARRQVESDPTVAPRIAGITTPGPMVLRLRFDGRIPPLVVNALTLPAAAPVPAEYARRLDAHVPSRYTLYAVGTGPYMVENDESGRLTGHRPGVGIDLVRNPQWDPATDRRPAFLDRIRIESGYSNARTAALKILDGEGMISGDFAPDPVTLGQAARERPSQLMMAPAGSVVYASLNTTIPPLDDIKVRRAIVAATDRVALQRVRGGAFSGALATHFIPPGVAGFDAAGGLEGPGFDFLVRPQGAPALAARYMRQAGYPEGTYTGDQPIQIVTDNTTIGKRSAEIVRQGLDIVGIPAEVKAVSRETMYSGFCNVPAEEVAICPNVGLVRLFNDAQTMLVPGFSGEEIKPVNNSNWPQLDVFEINRAMDRASSLRSHERRTEAWARIDRAITAQAPAIPIVWVELGLLSSADVVNVIDPVTATSDLNLVSLTDPCDGDKC